MLLALERAALLALALASEPLAPLMQARVEPLAPERAALLAQGQEASLARARERQEEQPEPPSSRWVQEREVRAFFLPASARRVVRVSSARLRPWLLASAGSYPNRGR